MQPIIERSLLLDIPVFGYCFLVAVDADWLDCSRLLSFVVSTSFEAFFFVAAVSPSLVFSFVKEICLFFLVKVNVIGSLFNVYPSGAFISTNE